MKSSSLMFLSVLGAVAMALVFSFHSPDAHAAAGSLLASLSDPGAALGALGFGLMGRTSIAQLREERNTIAKECNDMMESLPKDAKWTDEQVKTYDAKLDKIETLDASISRQQRLLDKTADEHFKPLDKKSADPVTARAREVFHNWIGSQDQSFSAEQWMEIRNVLSTTTGSQGGFTVPSEISKELIESLKEYGGMREAAYILNTSDGRPLSFPTTNGTAEVGEIVAENAGGTGQEDPSFGSASLNAFKYTSKIIVVPWELLQDSMIDVEALVMARIRERLGRINNLHFTVGTGSGQPTGIVTAATSGKVGTTGQTVTVIYDDLVDLQHSVDPAYRRQGSGFMMADGSIRVVRKVKDAQGRPIFNPGYEMGVPGGAPDLLLGSPIRVNQDMPAMAANAKSILFGNFKKYYIRDVVELIVRKYEDSNYARNGQVGYQAWNRCGGNLLDTAAVKFYQNSAT